jgi:hypothetical protein
MLNILTKRFSLIIFFSILSLFILKIYLNSFLLAENGDTYDFFRVSYEYRQGDFLVESKRMPLFAFVLSLVSEENFVIWGRIVNNLFYFLSIFFVFLLIQEIFKLEFKISLLYSLVFAFFYPILDNSFFIMADTMFLFLALTFLYLAIQNKNIYLTTLLTSLAFYTRFEGVLLFLSFAIFLIFKKKYKDLLKSLTLFSLLLVPFLVQNYLIYGSFIKLGYLEDTSGFILNFKNLFKAFGTLIFLTGGFWFLPILISRLSLISKINFKSLFVLIFVLFSALLISWGFYIRLYSVPLLISFFALIYLLENYQKPTKSFYLYTFLSLILYIFTVQYLDHIDLGETKISKLVVIFSSISLAFIYMSFEKIKNSKMIFISFIILLNLTLFVTKFIQTREKYFTLALGSEYSNSKFKNLVGYADESGVSKWYFKDFSQDKNFLQSNLDFDSWVKTQKLEYLIVTDELGFQDSKLKPYLPAIKSKEKVKEFKSGFSGGRTVIYKIR